MVDRIVGLFKLFFAKVGSFLMLYHLPTNQFYPRHFLLHLDFHCELGMYMFRYSLLKLIDCLLDQWYFLSAVSAINFLLHSVLSYAVDLVKLSQPSIFLSVS